MQLFKNMEVILMLAFGIVCATVALRPAGAGNPAQAAPAAAHAATLAANTAFTAHNGTDAAMPTVRIIGRRPTLEEKRTAVSSVD